MGDSFPYEKRASYPHMMPRDVALWERFIDANPGAFDRVWYDVKCGEGAAHDTIVNEATGGDAADLYYKKIDVVGVKNDLYYVIEVKPNALFGAIGQVICYTVLWEELVDPGTEAQPMIITDRLAPDMKRLCAHHGIRIVVV